jgi:hypothetical protein
MSWAKLTNLSFYYYSDPEAKLLHYSGVRAEEDAEPAPKAALLDF